MSRDIERGRLGWGIFLLAKVRTVVDGRYVHQGGGGRAYSPLPRLWAWGSWGGPYWTSRVYTGSGYGRHVWGFVPWDRGSPSRIETHGKVPRIKEIFDDSGSSIILSRTGFPTRLKCKKVRIVKGKTSWMIVKGKTSWMIVKEKLSERAVMKEDRLGRVCLQERRLTPKGT